MVERASLDERLFKEILGFGRNPQASLLSKSYQLTCPVLLRTMIHDRDSFDVMTLDQRRQEE